MLNKMRNIGSYLSKYEKYAPMVFSTRSIVKQHTYSDVVRGHIFNGQHRNLAKSILINDFTQSHEPLCYHLSPRNFEFCLGPYLENAIKDQLSLFVEVSEVFAGIVINNDFTFVEDEDFLKDLRKRDYFGFDMIMEIEKNLNHDFMHEMKAAGLYKAGNIMRMLLLGIDPHYEHRGLATFLVDLSIERATGLGFKYIIAACTNEHMQHATEKCGFECINIIEYDNWEYPKHSGIFPKKGIAEITGFNEMSLMVKKL